MEITRGLTLRNKLFMSFFFLSVLITLAMSFILFIHMRTDHLNTLKRDLIVITGLALDQGEVKLLDETVAIGDKAAVDQATEKLKQKLIDRNLTIEKIKVWQIDKVGESVKLVNSDLDINANQTRYSEALKAIKMDQPVVAEIPDSNLGFEIYAPIKVSNNPIRAVVSITVKNVSVVEDLEHFFIQVVKVALLAILVAAVISSWLARGFCKRLLHLNDAIDAIAAGKLNTVLQEKGKDEVTNLAKRLNQLARILASEREEMLLSAIESLITALEAKDTYTYGHSSQVSAIAHSIAKQIGLSEQEVFTVRIAALLHDIGKIGVPDYILNKPGRLDEEERRIIEQHPEIGAKILSGIPALASVTEIVKHHHARWDGKGYPQELKGDAIPLGARIITIADTYQAMISDRPYRKGLDKDIAVEELRRYSGQQFDPKLVAVFIKVWPDCLIS